MSIGRIRTKSTGSDEVQLCLQGVDGYDGVYEYPYLGYQNLGEANRSVGQSLDWTHKKRHGKYLEGGNLDIRRAEIITEPAPVDFEIRVGRQYRRIHGFLYPRMGGGITFPDVDYELPVSGASATYAYGATGWNRFRPGRPKFSYSVFLAELRDLPAMLRARSYAHRNLGSHYLSLQFGWMPFLRDIRKMYLAQKQLERTIADLISHNGKWMRRSGSVKKSEDTTGTWETTGSVNFNFNQGNWGAFFDFTQSGARATRKSVEHAWFVGSFRYYIPNIEKRLREPRWSINLERRIMGLTLTPGDVWAALPWSWLIDYFSNAGDVLDNITNGYVDDLAAKYAYVMRTHSISVHQTSWTKVNWGGPQVQGTVQGSQVTKCRQMADPFGFTAGASLSNSQLAILAALGVSRL